MYHETIDPIFLLMKPLFYWLSEFETLSLKSNAKLFILNLEKIDCPNMVLGFILVRFGG
jgi:hypothetical protein